MRQETRFKFNAYLSRVAELNGIDAGDVSKKFTVEPSVTQMRTYRQREWAKLKSEKLRIQNQIKEIELVSDAVKSLESVMALSEEQRKNLVQLSGADELVQLKILLAVYRRLSPLVELQNSGKANFSAGKNKNLKASD